jgi:hypothetical protein
MKISAFALLLILIAGRARAEEVPTVDLDGCPLFDAGAARRAIWAELTVPAAQRARLAELRIVITCPDADGALVEIRSSGAPERQRFAFGNLVGAQRLRLMAVVVAELVARYTASDRPGNSVSSSPGAATPPGRGVTRAALISEVGAGFVAGWSDAGITGGASVELWVGAAASRWAGHLSLLGLSSEHQTLPPGSVSWTRPRLAAGGRYRVARGDHVSIDLRADAVAAVLVLSGEGFTANETAVAFDPGLSVGARLDVPWGRWTWFLEASALGWLRGQRAQVTGLAETVDVPRGEVLLHVGLTVGLGQEN